MPLNVCYEGKAWKAYYFNILNLERDLKEMVRFLDSMDKAKEEVTAIIPDIGLVQAQILMGSDFTGVKGCSIITKKRVESAQPNIVTVTYGDLYDRGLMKCLKCGKTFAKDYNKCPYCGSGSKKLLE